MENDYLQLLDKVLVEGDQRVTRNGQVRSLFGERISFDLRSGFPLLTTKKMFFKGIVAELLWFLRGQTDNELLTRQGVHIWDGNSSREALDRRGLHDYQEHECGPIYGYQWRRFGVPYRGCHVPIENVPITHPAQDQLAEIIRQIKEDPNSRRMVMTSWNPLQAHEMCLEPCHMVYQFYVTKKHDVSFLSCQMYQRSADMFLGVPFNIASTALLTMIIAHLTETVPSEITICFGDLHLYENHVGVAQEQLSRRLSAFALPRVVIDNSVRSLEELSMECIQLEDYQHHSSLPAPMSI
jgi:thymidylate synthase